MVAPQGHQLLGGGSAPVDVTRVYIYAPQGHKYAFNQSSLRGL